VGEGSWSRFFWPLFLASAVDLFSFRYRGKTFAIPSSDRAAATVKDNAAETTALKWAVGLYGAQDVDLEPIQDVNFDGLWYFSTIGQRAFEPKTSGPEDLLTKGSRSMRLLPL
jgi:hypothetical protein